jgi:hypothetical protein
MPLPNSIGGATKPGGWQIFRRRCFQVLLQLGDAAANYREDQIRQLIPFRQRHRLVRLELD